MGFAAGAFTLVVTRVAASLALGEGAGENTTGSGAGGGAAIGGVVADSIGALA